MAYFCAGEAELSHMDKSSTATSSSLAHNWGEALGYETAEVERAGVNAAMISVLLTATSEDLAIDSRRATSLLTRRLRSTDRLAATSADQLSILVTPTNSLTQTMELMNTINAALFDHRIPAVTSFAHRRPNENLVDTWARAQAELDRVMYRARHSEGITV